MKRLVYITFIMMFAIILGSCAKATLQPTNETNAPAESIATPDSVNLPLSELGSYHVGIKRNIAYEDSSRSGRKVTITIWYPAIRPQDSTSSDPIADATPDVTHAPYPLILSSSKVGFIFAPHLASHGFVYVGINGQDSKDHWGQWLTDYPLDIVFALDQIASNPLIGLENMIDTNHAGAMGYSFDGYNSLALSGARVDSAFYLTQCKNANTMKLVPPEWWVDYICNPTGGWDELALNAGSTITTGDNGLWKAMTDERIRAVMPMAPEGAWLFGERGLATVNRPTLIISATADDINIYDLEAAYIFEHLGTSDKIMISFVDQGHLMIYDTAQVARMKHFAAAFFGYHLQTQGDYSKYFSEDFVAQYGDLAWGVYKK